MKIGLIADIHSNLYSLVAVLDSIKSMDVDLVVCLGDLVGYCTFPNEVIDVIRHHNILTVMGNYDDAVGNERLVCGCDYPDPKDAENAGISLNWTIDTVTDENKKYLRGLPKEVTMKLEEKTITFVHGSLRKINEYLKEGSREAEEVIESFNGDILICGHTHVPYFKTYGHKMLINCGSAGKPKTGSPDANYIILEVTKDKADVEIISVPYDFEKTAQAIENNNLPKEFAKIIRTGNAH